MRIVVVSAHYPPNFVSGGTLGPQRISRGLRDRGHEVSVYAGWLGEREPLETWTDLDEEGMPIRWIVTSPWTDWTSTRNYDNPDVAADFALHLEDVRPDLVHVHSLQSLGHGLVQACIRAGVRVVVTMHDFWWICGRQFLSDRALQPCSLVVSCGMCHCSVDRDWLDRRDSELLRTLRGVDQILAVSDSAASVLRANGIGLDRNGPTVVVDENGLPPLPEPGRARLDGLPVVFLYTGGSEALKGAHVVIEAASRLEGVEGWTLDAYGVERHLEESSSPPPKHVRVQPRFSPADAERVFDGADVLILPSVVRESHSLVTREALSRGMPVITSDTLGPEEVVTDGENGYVVPAGDPAALALAMRRVIEDEGARRHLAAAARQPVRIRPVDEQIDGLDHRFRDLVARTPSEVRPPRRRIRRVLFMVGIDGAPLRYRAHFPAEALALHGVQSWIRHYRSPEIAALATVADALVVYRVPATRQVLATIDSVRARGVPAFFDVDDLIFDPELASSIPSVQALPRAERDLYLEGTRRYRTTLEACDAFIGTTEELVDHVRTLVGIPAMRWWNGVGVGPARCSDAALAHPRTPGPLRIGYMSGTKTHDRDWHYVEPAVVQLLRSRPDCELWLGGLVTPTAALERFGGRVRRIPLQPWWDLPWTLRDLDVNLAPLEPGSRFNQAKSAIKWLEAALAGTVTVATATTPFRECIEAGVNGELAETVTDFHDRISDLLDDDLRRARMASRARRHALLNWSPHLQGRLYLDILEGTVPERAQQTTWGEPVALDEPWLDVPIEDYIVPDPMVLAPIPADFSVTAPGASDDETSPGSWRRFPASLRPARRAVAAALRARTGRS